MGETYSTADKRYKFKECYITEESDNKIVANCSYYTREFDEVGAKYNTTPTKQVQVTVRPIL